MKFLKPSCNFNLQNPFEAADSRVELIDRNVCGNENMDLLTLLLMHVCVCRVDERLNELRKQSRCELQEGAASACRAFIITDL